MSKEDEIKAQGIITKCLPGTNFEVKLTRFGEQEVLQEVKILCHIGGKMRVKSIRLTEGDVVDVAMSPYDTTKGRIVYRR
jgi:translation initiation factor IF-1